MSRNDRARLRRRVIGYVFQDFNLLPGLTVSRERLAPARARRHAREGRPHRRRRGARGARRRATVRTAIPDELSGGERQRVAIARAIVGDRRPVARRRAHRRARLGQRRGRHASGAVRVQARRRRRARDARRAARVVGRPRGVPARRPRRRPVGSVSRARVVAAGDVGPMSSGGNGGIPARRAVSRWAWRLFRRDWRQHLLILSMLTVSVAAAVGLTCAAFNIAPVSGRAEFGDANHWFTFKDVDPQTLPAKLDAARAWFGQIDAIGHRRVALPGTVKVIDYRSQQPDGAFGKPLLRLRSGRYPVADDEAAITDSVAHSLGLKAGSTVDLDGVKRTVVGTVENPSDLGDEFVLLPPSAITSSTFVTMLVKASNARVDTFRPPGDTGRIVAARDAIPQDVLAGVLTLVVTTLVLFLVALIAAASFTVIAHRRLPQLGMMAAVGANREAAPPHHADHGRGHRSDRGSARHRAGVARLDRSRTERRQRSRVSHRRAAPAVGIGGGRDRARHRRGDGGGVVAGPNRVAHPADAGAVGAAARTSSAASFRSPRDRSARRRRRVPRAQQHEPASVDRCARPSRGRHGRRCGRHPSRQPTRHPGGREARRARAGGRTARAPRLESVSRAIGRGARGDRARARGWQ